MSAGRAGRVFGRLVLTTTRQPGGAPLADRGATVCEDDERGRFTVRSVVVVPPWRLRRRAFKPRYGPRWCTEDASGALVLGWRR